MKRFFAGSALSFALLISLAAPDASAKTKPKHTAAHASAVKQCNDTYHAAMKEAKTKKGTERKEAEAAARSARKSCLSAAPQ